MASKLNSPCSGFRHGGVVDFINDKIARHVKGPEFYHAHASLSWKEVEDQLRAILEDSTVPSEAKEACAWGGLALGMNFAQRQRGLHECRVKWLQDFNTMYKSAAQALASNLQAVSAQREAERMEVDRLLQQTQAKLAEMEKERNLLRWKLSQVVLGSVQKKVEDGQDQATTRKIGGEKSADSSPSPPSVHTATATSKTSFPCRSCDIGLLSEVEAQGMDPLQSERERRASNPHWQKKKPTFRRAGDWDCPWCKAVNFSGRETCYLCGRGIWLQSPK